VGAAVVGPGHGVELLLASGVPDLQADVLIVTAKFIKGFSDLEIRQSIGLVFHFSCLFYEISKI